MKKSKKTDEKNSLETLLLKGKRAYEGNKAKTYQYLLIAVLVIVAFVAVRSKLSGASGKYNAADSAYYAATQAAFAGQGIVDGAVLSAAAASYKNNVAGSVLHADAGDAFLSAGQVDVAAKHAYSRGVKETDGETKVPADPSINFNAAYEAYQAAVASTDAEVRARAYYGSGVAQEALATVAADAAAVEAAVEKAKDAYKKVAEVSSDSPYCALAAKALSNLERSLTLDYYKSVANQFVNLPEPSSESILPESSGELTSGEQIGVEGFEMNDDSSEAEETEPTELEEVTVDAE